MDRAHALVVGRLPRIYAIGTSVGDLRSSVVVRRTLQNSLNHKGAVMQVTTILPDHLVADPPFVAGDELPLGSVLEDVQGDHAVFRRRLVEDSVGLGANEQCFAPGAGMSVHDIHVKRVCAHRCAGANDI